MINDELKLKSCVKNIEELFNELITDNKKLAKENTYLKSEEYKDKELESMKNQLSQYKRMNNQYGLDDKNWNIIKDFKDRHREECSKAVFHYEIREFSIVTVFTCICSHCGTDEDIYI